MHFVNGLSSRRSLFGERRRLPDEDRDGDPRARCRLTSS